MTKNKVSLERWVDLARSRDSLPIENSSTWEKWVAYPVISHILAPRQARAALEVIGTFADKGYEVSEILEFLINCMDIEPSGVRGQKAGESLLKIFKKL